LDREQSILPPYNLDKPGKIRRASASHKVPQGFESNPGTDIKVSLLSQKQKSANDLSNLMDVP